MNTDHKFFTIIIFFIISLNINTFSQENIPEWKNPQIFGINKLDAHAHFFPYESEKLAEKNDKNASNWYQSLNGDWKFILSEGPT